LEWSFILAVIASALLSQQRSVAAIAQWATSHATTLVSTFQPARGRVPSEATLRRTLRQVEIARLEQCLTQLSTAAVSTPSPTDPSHAHGYAVDGNMSVAQARMALPRSSSAWLPIAADAS
jgi:hypothetical protein